MVYHEEYVTDLGRREKSAGGVPGAASGKLTRNEDIVYQELIDRQIPAKAYELLETLMDKGMRSPMTIYRALDALIRKGFAKKVVSLNAFIALRPDSVSEVSAFVTCRNCKETKKIEISKEYIETIFGGMAISLEEVFIEANGECTTGGCARQALPVKQAVG